MILVNSFLLEIIMLKEGKKTAFLKGTISLSISVIVTKILGVMFKVPLSYVLGDEGMGYFNTAYAIYGLFYILCTAGVPKSIMLISSELKVKRKIDNASFSVLLSGLKLFFIIGITLSLINILCAPVFTTLIGNKKAFLSVVAVAPSIFFVSLCGALRGYYGSNERLGVIALSQLAEAFVKLIIGLMLALIGVRLGCSVSTVSALAIFGITLGSVVSFLFMFIPIIKIFKEKSKQNSKNDNKELERRILKNALPITLSSTLINLGSILDLTIIIRRLSESGMNEEYANSLYGNYTTLAVPMFNLVVSVLAPIATSYMPRLSDMFIKKETQDFARTLNRLLWGTVIISVPASLVFCFYSFDLLDILFSVQSSAIGAEMLVCLSFGLSLITALTVINTAIESQGRIALTVISLLFGSFVKLISSYILIGNDLLGILGAPLGTVLSYLISLIISVFALNCFKVKTHAILKIMLIYIVGFLTFYPFYVLIYKANLLKMSFLSMVASVGASCLIYLLILIIAYLTIVRSNIAKINKKSN